MKSLYEELNGSYISIGDAKIPALVSADTNYEQWMYGNAISIMLSNYSIMAVQSEKLCTQRMLLKASIPVSERLPRKEPSRTKTHSSNCSISELPSSTKNGTAAKCRIGLWSEISSQPTTKLKPVLRNTST